MQLGHLLTRSGLTYLEVSSEVCHGFFCQLGNSVSLSWAVCREAFCLHVVSSSSCIPGILFTCCIQFLLYSRHSVYMLYPVPLVFQAFCLHVVSSSSCIPGILFTCCIQFLLYSRHSVYMLNPVPLVFQAFCLHVVSSSSCIPAVCLEPVLFLIPLQCVKLFCNLSQLYPAVLLIYFISAAWHP